MEMGWILEEGGWRRGAGMAENWEKNDRNFF